MNFTRYHQHKDVILVNPHAEVGQKKALIIQIESHREIGDGIDSFTGIDVDNVSVDYHSTPVGDCILTPTYFMPWHGNASLNRSKMLGYYDAQEMLNRMRAHMERANQLLHGTDDSGDKENLVKEITDCHSFIAEILLAMQVDLKDRFTLAITNVVGASAFEACRYNLNVKK